MADYIAVVDVETTGLFPERHDRIVEIGIVITSADGRIHEQYESLVNPERDLGPTGIHRISAAEVTHAPKFRDIAGDVMALLRSARVVAGHNISFDRRFLIDEYRRVDVVLPAFPCFCTYQSLGRSSLEACCQEFEVLFEGEPHAALSDARATARLIHSMVRLDPESAAALNGVDGCGWPDVTALRTAAVPRRVARERLSQPPTFLQRIIAKGSRDVDVTSEEMLSYLALLDRVLEDRSIDETESESLVSLAESLGLGSGQVREAHSSYLQSLVVHALGDGVVTDIERRDLTEVARLIGCDQGELNGMLESASDKLKSVAASPSSTSTTLSGKTVCFTGELQSRIKGDPLTRELAEAMAERAGMLVASGVTKKLDILVVADPSTQSGKAKKARAYGTRILAEAVFWPMIGMQVE